MEKTLELIFTKSDGAKKTLSIADPREGLTLAEAKTAADKIIDANVLTSSGLELTEFTEARIKTVTIDVLAQWIRRKYSKQLAILASRQY